jgi:hypothetical protein
MARTPDGPIVKEIKPTAAIAWKKITFGDVIRKGKPIPLVDMPLKNAHGIGNSFRFDDNKGMNDRDENFKSVFIDTGENGIFSKGEFKAIGSLGQMEIVTPEEIAECVVSEIAGGNTGHDIIQGLDGFSLGPSYRGGMLFNSAIQRIESLEKENKVNSIAFEMLGPPRLSKLLFESHILKRIAKSMNNVASFKPEALSNEALSLLENDKDIRSQMLSIGLVVLLPDGKKYLRGRDVKIPVSNNQKEITIGKDTIDKWCQEGWIDLRPENFNNWKKRIKKIIEQAKSISENDSSSRFTYTKDYWNNFSDIDEGKIVGWIFEYEDKGWRFKR